MEDDNTYYEFVETETRAYFRIVQNKHPLASRDNSPTPSDNNDNENVETETDAYFRAVRVLDKKEDFTVLQKPIKSCRLCNCEESTEVLMSSEYQNKSKPTYSGTDSDVEILMSEEIIDSDWSSDYGLEDPVKDSTILKDTVKLVDSHLNSQGKFASPSGLLESSEDNSFKTQPSTDFDVTGVELVDAALLADKYRNLDRTQLLNIIKKQEICIQALEATVERYQKAQDRLFEHVEALRLGLSEIRITPLHKENLSENKLNL